MASSNSGKPQLPLFPLAWYIPLHGLFADAELIRLLESLLRLYEEHRDAGDPQEGLYRMALSVQENLWAARRRVAEEDRRLAEQLAMEEARQAEERRLELERATRRRRAREEQAEEEERSVRRRLTLELSSDED